MFSENKAKRLKKSPDPDLIKFSEIFGPLLLSKLDDLAKQILFESVFEGNFEDVKHYSSQVSEVDFCHLENFKTPLYLAAQEGYHEIVKFLLSNFNVSFSDLNNKYGNAPIHIASINGHIEVVKVLLNFGDDINRVDIKGRSAVELSIKFNHIDLFKFFIDRDPNLDYHDLMQYALAFEREEIVELINHKQKPSKNPSGSKISCASSLIQDKGHGK